MNWILSRFEALTLHQLYDVLKLRQQIFVVEQNCVYPDLDDYDKHCYHLLGFEGDELICCSRILPPGVKYEQASIGRVALKKERRGIGIADELMNTSISDLYKLFGKVPIKIGAQAYLENFYSKFGFKTISEPYDEDGILHIDMLKID